MLFLVMGDQTQFGMPRIDDTLCLCGRPNVRPHCPFCGSSQVLCSAKKRDFITRPDGTEVELRVFRCRVCGSNFNDDHRTMCNAPAPRESQRRHNVPNLPQPHVRSDGNIIYNPKVPPMEPEGLKHIIARIKKDRGLE